LWAQRACDRNPAINAGVNRRIGAAADNGRAAPAANQIERIAQCIRRTGAAIREGVRAPAKTVCNRNLAGQHSRRWKRRQAYGRRFFSLLSQFEICSSAKENPPPPVPITTLMSRFAVGKELQDQHSATLARAARPGVRRGARGRVAFVSQSCGSKSGTSAATWQGSGTSPRRPRGLSCIEQRNGARRGNAAAQAVRPCFPT
jgi:hypothetical protein